MAEDKLWIITEDSTMGQIYETAFVEYKNMLEKQHSQISEEEWVDIVSDLELDENRALVQFQKKPSAATSGPWWELEAEVETTFELAKDLPRLDGGTLGNRIEIDCWDHERRFINKYENNGSLTNALEDMKSLIDKTYEQMVGFNRRIAATGLDASDLYDDTELAIQSYNFINEITAKAGMGNFIFYNFKVSDLKSIFNITEIFRVIFNVKPDSLSDRVQDFVLGELRNLQDRTKKFQELATEISEELDALMGWSQSKQTFADFKDSYILAVQKLGIQKIVDDSEAAAIQNIAASTLEDLSLGLLDLESYKEDLSEIRRKIEDKRKEEVLEAFADNLIFSEQCFMLSKLLEFITYKKSKPLAFPLPYKSGASNPDLCGSSKAANANSKNQPILMQGESFSFMNKLAVEPSQQFLFNEILPHEISSITPNIELFKVVTEGKGAEAVEYEIPIKFNVNTTAPRVDKAYRPQRGTGVGLKSFKFSYDGSDPFSAKKAISANLSIFASSMTDLLRPNETGLGEKGEVTYRYTDLALKTGTVKEDSTLTDQERENIDKLNFRLKVVVQWAADRQLLRGIRRDEIKNALYNSAITLYLTPVIHTFDFDDTGAVTFNINYQAYIEDFFTNDNFDIFASLIGVKEGRRYVLDFFKDQKCDLLAGEEFKKFQEFDSAFIIQNNKKALNSIVNNLHQRNLINYLNMSYNEIQEWMRNPAAFKGKAVEFSDSVASAKPNNIAATAIEQAIAKSGADSIADFGSLRLSLVANSQENQNIAFVYLSDLISVVMNMIEEQLYVLDDKKLFLTKYADATQNVLNNFSISRKKMDNYITTKYQEDIKKKKFANMLAFRKMRIVLGPINFSSNTNTQVNSLSCSIGDIPISLNYLIDFLSGKVIAKDLSHYPISKFIKDVVNELIRNFINSEDCSGSNTSQRMSINSTTVVGYDQEVQDGDDFRYLDNLTFLTENSDSSSFLKKGVFLIDQIPDQYFPLLKISADRDNPNTSKGIEFMTNYYIFSAGRSYPSDKYVGNQSKDAEAGIFHYVLGRDRGIVKNIKLQKTNTPGLKEVRFEQEGYAGLEQLREVYNASIDCYLNVQTFPGTYIYIVPEGFAPDMGLEILTDDNGKKIDLTKFGIGGYYMITKTEHDISPGTGNTSIEASWVASKDGTYGKNPKTETRGDGEGSEKVKKCMIAGSGGDR